MKLRNLFILSAISFTVTACSLFAGCGHIHTYGNWKTVRPAGCFITQEDVRICSGCGETKTRTSSALGHVYKDGICTECGRHDWNVTDISDPLLYNSDFCFRALASEAHGKGMQELYTLIDEDAQKYHAGESSSAVLGEYDYGAYGLTNDEAVAVWKVYLDDHPLYYWMSKTSLANDESKTITVSVDGEYTNAEVRTSLNQTIYETANEWRKDTPEIAYLAALSYHDKIIERVDYLSFDSSPQWAHNIAGVFGGKDVVCEGYARTFQLMLNLSGIENILVSGQSDGGAHVWNLVKLDDGNWYWFDLTYDDSPNWMWGVKYNYFAVNDTENINWQDDSPINVSAEISFLDEHTPINGTDVNYLPALPPRAENAYNGVGELLLRKTFTEGNFTYAHVGHKAVQLVKCTAKGNVSIPAYTKFDGTEYKVISVGGMNRYGLFGDSLGEYEQIKDEEGNNTGIYHNYVVFQETNSGSSLKEVQLGTLYFPETIRFMWSNALPNATAFNVAEDNEYYTSVDGVLFTKQQKTLIKFPALSKQSEYVIPDETNYIASNAFSGVHNLQKLTIGSGVLTDGGRANWGTGWLEPSSNSIPIINIIVHEFDHIAEYGVNIVISEENHYLQFVDGNIREINYN